MSEEFYHRWLYSVVPLYPRPALARYDTDNWWEELGGVFVTALCPNCKSAITVKLLHNQTVGLAAWTALDIPKTGCVAP